MIMIVWIYKTHHIYKTDSAKICDRHGNLNNEILIRSPITYINSLNNGNLFDTGLI